MSHGASPESGIGHFWQLMLNLVPGFIEIFTDGGEGHSTH